MSKTGDKTLDNNRLDIRDYTMIPIFAALMAICSWISIPAQIPFTMQTFGVFLSVGLLGGKRGTLSVLIYLLLGAAGLPVFSGFSGGIGHILGVTGGYIVGFLFSALAMWAIEAAAGTAGNREWILAASMAAGLIICYAFGTLWFRIVYTRNTGDIGTLAVLSMCVFPYIIPDAVKIGIAMLLCRRLRPAIDRF